MKKLILLIALTIALAACAPTGKPIRGMVANSPCVASPRGYTDVVIKYRVDTNFMVKVRMKSDVGEDNELRIKLKPKPGSENVTVETIGISGTLPPTSGGGSTPYAWLNGSGTARNLPKSTLVLCIPDGVPIGTVYKFDLDVGGTGLIDPRIEVTW